MKMNMGVEIQLHVFLNSVLDELSGQLDAPAALPRGNNPWYPVEEGETWWVPEPV